MDEKIHFLLTLQEYEQRLEGISLPKFQSRLSQLQETVRNLTEDLQQAHQDLLRDQQQLQASEGELYALEENLRQCLGQQAISKKAETFQALGMKITQLRKQISDSEDAILQHIEAHETQKTSHVQLEMETQKQVTVWESEIAQQKTLYREAEQALQVLREKIKIFRENIVDPALLHRYDQVRSRGIHFPWVASVENHRCQGCHIRLSPEQDQFFQKNPESQDYCENCGRLLYVPSQQTNDTEEDETE
jgi:predicted  nucleic acid-binding Zn-ribbon protein